MCVCVMAVCLAAVSESLRGLLMHSLSVESSSNAKYRASQWTRSYKDTGAAVESMGKTCLRVRVSQWGGLSLYLATFYCLPWFRCMRWACWPVRRCASLGCLFDAGWLLDAKGTYSRLPGILVRSCQEHHMKEAHVALRRPS